MCRIGSVVGESAAGACQIYHLEKLVANKNHITVYYGKRDVCRRPCRRSAERKGVIMNGLKFTCAKCENQACDVAEFRATGGFLTKIFDIQSKKFTTVTCTRCKYTEIYRADSSMLGNIFDFFTD
jgi:predicted nucleic-acid-binding Zn-ribbon protein